MMRPSEQNTDAAGISAFVEAVEHDEAIEPHGLIVQRHGERIAEGYWAPHDRGRGRLVYSLSKSFTGAALGLQINEGRLDLDDFVGDHLPEYDLHEDAQRLRIRHIASMATGHTEEMLGHAVAADPDDAVRGFLSLPAPHEPGTVFAYNQPPVLTLALILERLAGERLSSYLQPRLLDPLGITTFRWAPWASLADMGFSGVFTDLDAIAKLGQVHLDGGKLGDRNVLSRNWVADASTTHTKNPDGETIDWQQGYGFQLWQSQHGYRGDGAFGQFMVILPEHDAVIAMFANTDELQLILDRMWEHLLPAFDRPGSAEDDNDLAARLESLRLPTATERLSVSCAIEPHLSGNFAAAEPTETSHRSIMGARFDGGRLVIAEGEHELEVPMQQAWVTEGNVATNAALRPDGSLVVDIAFLNTPHRLELTLGDGVVASDWGRLPLFGAGINGSLHEIAVAPAPD